MPETSREPSPATEAPTAFRTGIPAEMPAEIPGERRGCLFALSQPPLVIFLAVIGCLLLMAAVHDLFVL
ncbi:hypothetical protein QWM81_14880 [Streptomyces ficellus]|uniref:ABC transporter permease n=2 Tax=Streptomyces ficellus TaxID=1977088 RepID=A0ABT7Z771_9ACTN|nr:hypothetical protein [Streptomyces ficellus]MDN3295315.1 hypothetical protein [Streptomyces ficellus]